MTGNCRRDGGGAAALLAFVGAAVADAKSLKWARSGDALTLDPHAQNEGPTHNLMHLFYEPLVLREIDGKLEPRWQCRGRSRATRACGSSSCARMWGSTTAMLSTPTMSCSRSTARCSRQSNMKDVLSSVDTVSRIDADTIQIKTKGPNPLLPAYLTNLFMMDKEWAEANNTHDSAGLQGEDGQLRGPQRQRHRCLRPRLARAGRDERMLKLNEAYWGKGRFSARRHARSPT